MIIQNNTPMLRKAMDHVRTFHPEVTTVVFGVDSRWRFCADDVNESPCFDERIDVSILEDAQNEANSFGFPCVFSNH